MGGGLRACVMMRPEWTPHLGGCCSRLLGWAPALETATTQSQHLQCSPLAKPLPAARPQIEYTPLFVGVTLTSWLTSPDAVVSMVTSALSPRMGPPRNITCGNFTGPTAWIDFLKVTSFDFYLPPPGPVDVSVNTSYASLIGWEYLGFPEVGCTIGSHWVPPQTSTTK